MVPAAAAAILVAAVAAIDLLFREYHFSLPVAALLDESAHVATLLVLLAAVGPIPSGRFIGGSLLGVVLIDVDHVPMQLGWDFLTAGTGRPYSHSLAGILVLVCIALASPKSWRPSLLGAATGLAVHLVRDAATGGIALYWPLSWQAVRLPYGAYALTLVLAAGATQMRHRWRR